MRMSAPHNVMVRTTNACYDVQIGAGLLTSVAAQIDTLLGGTLAAGKARAFVVTSPGIWELWGPRLSTAFTTPPTVLFVPAGEQEKRLATVERLAEEMAAAGANRDSILFALGGGVVGDMTGFLSAIFMRGIRYVQLPTTLLAQVDSALGGKTGVNLATGKNLIGSFHHPLAVIADVDTLTTLPPRELRAGLQEAVKAGIIRDAQLFTHMQDHATAILSGDAPALTEVIAASVRVKAAVVAADEFETGVRMLLNLGHTLGHAIESVTGYTQLLHGEAVAWGMLAAIGIARDRGTLSADDAARMEQVIRAYGPLHGFRADPAQLVARTAGDKKNRGGARSFILPTGIGSATVVRDVTDAELLTAATRIAQEAAGLTA
jgi:3-dehydroquinate synthase